MCSQKSLVYFKNSREVKFELESSENWPNSKKKLPNLTKIYFQCLLMKTSHKNCLKNLEPSKSWTKVKNLTGPNNICKDNHIIQFHERICNLALSFIFEKSFLPPPSPPPPPPPAPPRTPELNAPTAKAMRISKHRTTMKYLKSHFSLEFSTTFHFQTKIV